MSKKNQRLPRWQNYFLKSGEGFFSFWKEYLGTGSRNILFIAGLGFDPRMCMGIESIIKTGGKGKRDCFLINFDEGTNSLSRQYDQFKEQNKQKLRGIIENYGTIDEVNLALLTDDSRRVGSTRAQQLFRSIDYFDEYDDIVVDISALPRGIYFSMIGKIIYLLDKESRKIKRSLNLHVIVAENAELDKNIVEDGVDEIAYYVHGFAGVLESESTGDIPTIWFPVIGEGKEVQLSRINDLINPDETCPVLPSASVDPLRGDRLLVEYRGFLFDQLLVEPINIMHAAERNPFDLYRQIHQAALRYVSALEPLGGCKIVVSALSSKLLSIGVLLSVYELKQDNYALGIANIECQGYQMNIKTVSSESTLFTMWLAGDCYNEQ